MGENFDQTAVKKVPFIELLKRIGPGIILAGVVIGPGNITTSAMMGSNYGYSMIWLVIPIAFMGISFIFPVFPRKTPMRHETDPLANFRYLIYFPSDIISL